MSTTTTARRSGIQRAEVPPREDVLRMAPFAVRAAGEVDGEEDDGLTLDGFAAVFNRVTIIDSWEGRFKEKASPGSMKKSFRENPPRIQFDHGRHPLIGSIPIAALRSIAEETHPELAPEGGAHVIGRLHDNWLIEPVRDAIASESVNKMSFRFSVVRQKWYDPDGKEIRDEAKVREELRRTWYEDVPDEELLLRDLKEVRVPELGPVVWPAYDDTSVGVRSAGDGKPTTVVVIDLGNLGDPDTRKTLARAVLLADAAEQSPPEAPPQTTGDARETPAGEHGTEAGDIQQDEPQTTERDTTPPPAGTHSVYVGSSGLTPDWFLPG